MSLREKMFILKSLFSNDKMKETKTQFFFPSWIHAHVASTFIEQFIICTCIYVAVGYNMILPQVCFTKIMLIEFIHEEMRLPNS